MTILVGGGGGVGPTGATGPAIAGLTSDGANGVLVAGELTAGSAGPTDPAFSSSVFGAFNVFSGQPSIDNSDIVAGVSQSGSLANVFCQPVLSLVRNITRNGHTPVFPVLRILNSDTALTPADDEMTIEAPSFILNYAGGIGRFGATPPTTPSAVTGALSAVVDPAAKAVLTSIIAALMADGGATDGTT